MAEKVPKVKPIVFQGTGYKILRADPNNLELYVLSEEGKYQFKGYYRTIEAALGSLVKDSSLIDESTAHDLDSYVNEIQTMKALILQDIKNSYNASAVEYSSADDDLFK